MASIFMSISRSDLHLSFIDLSFFLQIIKTYSSEANMVAHTCNPSVWEVKVAGSGQEFRLILGYIAGLRSAWAAYDPVCLFV